MSLFASWLMVLMLSSLPAAPARAKTGRTYYPDAEVAAARQKVRNEDWAKHKLDKLKRSCAWILKMSDQEVWDMVPPANQLRASNVAYHVGCPVHGKLSGHYPWHTSRDHPFQVQCPKGGEWYPSNKFIPWHDGGKEGKIDTHKKYVDDGTGYIAPDGQHYYFVAYYVFWQRWRKDIMRGLPHLAKTYLLTGDSRYAHKAAVLMAAVAHMYPNTNFSQQAVFSYKGPPPNHTPGGIMDRIWANSHVVSPCAVTYDAIFPIFGHDAKLAAFLKTKGVNNTRKYIEDRLMYKLVNRITGGPHGNHKIEIRGNFGMPQRSLSQLAVALDNDDPARGMTTRQMVDWIMKGGGDVRTALWNRFYHDGFCADTSSPNYSQYDTGAIFTVANTLRRVGVNLFEQPKMKRLAQAYLDLAVLGKHIPSIGDSGSVFGSERYGWSRQILLPIFETTGSPRVARALMDSGFEKEHDLWSAPPTKRVRQAAKQYPNPWPRHSRVLGGYGDAILESQTDPVGLSLYYGYAGGRHGHYDRLNLELFAFGKPMMPDLGYPVPLEPRHGYNKRMAWTSGTLSHYGVEINRHRQSTADNYTTWRAGDLNMVLAGPGVQVADAGAVEGAYPHRVKIDDKLVNASTLKDGYPDDVSLYRRTSLLIDQPGGKPYLFDLFRVQGGWEHAWSFHGPPNTQFNTFNADFGPVQSTGTLAGPDVKFGGKPKPPTNPSSGFQYLRNIRRAQAPDGAWGAQWLDKKKDENLRMTMLPGSVQRIAIGRDQPEQRKHPADPMPYIVAFNGSPKDRAAEVGSDFAAVVEPFQGDPNITRFRRLDSHGSKHALAAAVDRRTGTDQILTTLGEGGHLQARTDDGMLNLHGELGLIQHNDNAPDTVLAINAHQLRTPGVEILQKQLLTGRIASVDYEANTIRLDRPLPGAAALVGQTITFRDDGHGEAYQIKAARNESGATVLTLATPLIVGTGKVKSIAPSGTLGTDTSFGRLTVDGGDHTGRTLLGPDKHRGFKILHPVIDGKFDLAGAGAAVKKLFSGSGKDAKQFWIGAVGQRDSWRIPTYVQVRELGNHRYHVRLNAPARVTVTVATHGSGATWVYHTASNQWAPLKVEQVGRGQIRFDLNPDDLPAKGTVVKPR